MSNELAKPSFDDSLRNHLAKNKAKFISALDGQIEFERFAVVVMNAIRRTPKLAGCSVSSVVEAVTKCAELGLEPNGPLGHAFLIPYGDEAKLVIGFRGLLHLMYRGGALKDASAQVVYANDKFTGQFGTSPSIVHTIGFGKRGPPVGAYAVLRFSNGGEHIESMSVEEIEAVRARSKTGRGGPWETDWAQMACKTVLRRASKQAPMGDNLSQMAEAADADDDVIDVTPGASPTATEKSTDATSKVMVAVDSATEGPHANEP